MLTCDAVTASSDQFTLSANWCINAQSLTAIIGPSGAGKSTLLSAIAGFTHITAGRILWCGQDLNAIPPGQRPLSILFQDQNLFPHLTLRQNLGLGLRPNLKLDKSEWLHVDNTLDRIGLCGMGMRKPGTLSGGEAARAALGRVILRARPMLLLDEPFAALGPALRAEMRQLVQDIAADTKTTVLLITHNPKDARLFAENTIFVDQGIAYPPCPTDEIFKAPPSALQSYLGDTLNG